MSEQERAKIDRFIAWLLEHPEKIPAAEQALDLEQQKTPCAELHQPGTRGSFILPGMNVTSSRSGSSELHAVPSA